MTRKAFDAIMAGLVEVKADRRGEKTKIKEHLIPVAHVDVRALRQKLGMSQDKFARTFCFSAGSVRNWEQGRREPEGPARVLLTIIAREPEAVRRALQRR